jgi:hypothetical protein
MVLNMSVPPKLKEIVDKLEEHTDYSVNCGFDYVFSLSVSDAKYLLSILKDHYDWSD